MFEIKLKRGRFKRGYSILVGIILLLSVVGLAFGAEIQKEFKKHIDVFNQVKSYNDNYYFDCPKEATLAEAGRILNNIDSTMRGRIKPQEIINRCNRKNYFVISGKELPSPVKLCIEELKLLFQQRDVPKLAYNEDTLLFECLVQDHFKEDNPGLDASGIFTSRNDKFVDKVKDDYFNCANVPVEEGVNFSCSDYLAQNILDDQGIIFTLEVPEHE